MKILGDIGNTDIKICLVDNKFKIIKKAKLFQLDVDFLKYYNLVRYCFFASLPDRRHSQSKKI